MKASSPKLNRRILQPDLLTKCVFVGPTNAGKTSLVRRYVDGRFLPKATVGLDFVWKNVKHTIDDGTSIRVRMQIMDVSGESRFKWQGSGAEFYRYVDSAAVVFDTSDPFSFSRVRGWKQEIDEHVSAIRSNFPVLLVANKNDCEAAVSDEELESLCEECGFFAWVSCSAKLNEGVDLVFEHLLDNVVKANLSELKKRPPHSPALRANEKSADVAPKLSLNPETGKSNKVSPVEWVGLVSRSICLMCSC